MHEATLHEPFDELHFESMCINGVQPDQACQSGKKEVFASINIDLNRNAAVPATLKAKVDTGAHGSILPLRLYRQMYPNCVAADGCPKPGALKPSKMILKAYGGGEIPQCGVCSLLSTYQGTTVPSDLLVTNAPGTELIGLPTATALNLVTVHCAIGQQPAPIKDKEDLPRQYPKCFDGTGQFPFEYHITLDPIVPPVVHAARHVPITMKDEIRAELDSMVSDCVIANIEEGEPTAWVNSLVYRTKA